MSKEFPVKRDKRCACGGERRPGQRNCRECANRASREYRARQRERRRGDHSLALAAIAKAIRESIHPTSEQA